MYIYLYIAFFIYYFSVWLQMRGTFRRFSSKNLSKIARLLFYFFLYVLHMCVWLCGSVCVWCVWCVVCWCEWVEMSVHSWTKISSVCVCEAGSWHFYLQFPDFIFSTRRFSYLLSFCLRFRFRWTFLHFSFSASVFTSSLFGFFFLFYFNSAAQQSNFHIFTHSHENHYSVCTTAFHGLFISPNANPRRLASPFGPCCLFRLFLALLWLPFAISYFLSFGGGGRAAFLIFFIMQNSRTSKRQTKLSPSCSKIAKIANRPPRKPANDWAPKAPKKVRERESNWELSELSVRKKRVGCRWEKVRELRAHPLQRRQKFPEPDQRAKERHRDMTGIHWEKGYIYTQNKIVFFITTLLVQLVAQFLN